MISDGRQVQHAHRRHDVLVDEAQAAIDVLLGVAPRPANSGEEGVCGWTWNEKLEID